MVILGMILRSRLRNLSRQNSSFFLVFLLIGAAPLIVANIDSRGATLRDLGSKYLNISGEDYRSKGLLHSIAEGTKARGAQLWLLPRNSSEALLGKLNGLSLWRKALYWAVFAFYSCLFAMALRDLALWLRTRRRANPDASSVAAATMASLILATIAIGFFRSRYLIFCYFFLALLAGRFFARLPRGAKPAVFILPLILTVNSLGGLGMLARAENDPMPGLLRQLEALGITRGYTDYYVAYPVAFLSKEKIILSPSAGPVSLDRYPSYTERVRSANSVAYIFREAEGGEDFLTDRLSALGAKYKSSKSGPFKLFYEVSGDAAREIGLPLKFSGTRGKADGRGKD